MVVGVNIKREMVLSPNDEEVANSSKNIPNSRLEGTNHTLFQTKMVEIDTLSQTETAKKKTFWRGTYLYSLYKGLPPPPPGAKNAVQIMSLAAYASETNKGIFAWPKLKRTFSSRNKLVYSILFLFKFRTCCTQC